MLIKKLTLKSFVKLLLQCVLMVADHLQVGNILSQILIGMDQILTQKDPPHLEAKAAKKL
jgi:hypothetical protein